MTSKAKQLHTLMILWGTILRALSTWERADVEGTDCQRDDFLDNGELRGIGERIDYTYEAFDDCGDASATPRTPRANRLVISRTRPHYTGAISDDTGTVGEGIEDGALDDDSGIGFDPIAGNGLTGAFYSPGRRSELGSHADTACTCSGVKGCQCTSGVWGIRAHGPERWNHLSDTHAREQWSEGYESTGFAENPRATYLWRNAREREQRVSAMLQVIACGPMPRVLKARNAIRRTRNESICATLGMTLPASGSWPGVEANPIHGMVRVYTDSDGTKVTRIPDWSNVWLTKGQQADLLAAIELRLDGETIPSARIHTVSETACSRCDTLVTRIAFDPETGIPLCRACWIDCNPGELQIAAVSLETAPVNWTGTLAGALLDTLTL